MMTFDADWAFEIEDILLRAGDPMQYLGRIARSSPQQVFTALCEKVEEYSLRQLLWTDFQKKFDKFLAAPRHEQESAIKEFLSYWSEPQNVAPIGPVKTLEMAHVKGKKTVMDPIYREGYKLMADMLFDVRSEDFMTYRDMLLVANKSFHMSRGIPWDASIEIGKAYHLIPDIPHGKTVQELIIMKERNIDRIRKRLEIFLEQIPLLLEVGPKSKQWFVQYFGPSIRRYLPEYNTIAIRSSRKPDFNKGWKLFHESLKGATPTELGFNHQTYRNFTQRYRPMGQIVLLYTAHMLLHGIADSLEDEVTNLTNDIEKLCNSCDPHIYREAIRRLFLKEYPEYDHEAIINDLLKNK